MAAVYGLFLSCLLLNCVDIIGGIPEQGVRQLRLFSDPQVKDVIYAGISKSMYAGSVLSLDIKCTRGMTVDIAWGIRTAVCANEFLDDYVSFTLLSNEWNTIDTAVQSIGVNRQLVDNMNDHTYVKFRSQWFMCQDNATILLPNWSNHRFQDLKVRANPDNTRPPSTNTGNNDDAATPKPGRSTTVLSTTPRRLPTTPGVTVPGALVKVPSDNIYVFIIQFKNRLPDNGNLSVVVKTHGAYGYLSMIDWPLLPFYAVMCAMYALFLICWSVLCCCYCKDLLHVQYWIGAIIIIGFVEESLFLGEYHTVNKTAQSVPGVVIFGELVSACKRTLSRVLVIIVSVGYGIVKPRHCLTASVVAVVGVIYFIMSSVEGFMRATVHKAKEQTTGMTIFLTVLSLTDGLICLWIFTALVITMTTLRLRRNLVKLSLYRHFTGTLIFAVLASIAFLIWSLVEHKRVQCLTDWPKLWVDDAFWHLQFSVILLVLMILWRPSANNQRYAYSALANGADDEAEEPVKNDAFEGVKKAKSSSDGTRQSSDQTVTSGVSLTVT